MKKILKVRDNGRRGDRRKAYRRKTDTINARLDILANDIAHLKAGQREISEKAAHVTFIINNLIAAIADVRKKIR